MQLSWPGNLAEGRKDHLASNNATQGLTKRNTNTEHCIQWEIVWWGAFQINLLLQHFFPSRILLLLNSFVQVYSFIPAYVLL